MEIGAIEPDLLPLLYQKKQHVEGLLKVKVDYQPKCIILVGANSMRIG